MNARIVSVDEHDQSIWLNNSKNLLAWVTYQNRLVPLNHAKISEKDENSGLAILQTQRITKKIHYEWSSEPSYSHFRSLDRCGVLLGISYVLTDGNRGTY